MSEWIADLPTTLNDLPVGMWVLVARWPHWFRAGGAGARRFPPPLHPHADGCRHEAGGRTAQAEQWELQVQYGSNKHEVAEAVIQEWLRQGAPTPEPWKGVWFGLPWSYLPKRADSVASCDKMPVRSKDGTVILLKIGIRSASPEFREAADEYDRYAAAIAQMSSQENQLSDLAEHLVRD